MCINNCRLCPNLIISSNIEYEPTADTVDIVIPQRSFNNCERACLVLAQNFPTTATIDSPVEIIIGDDIDTAYPLVNRDGTPIYITQLRTRTIYPLRIRTTPTSGVFVYVGNRRLPNNNVTVNESIPVATPTQTTNTPKEGAG